ncbi:rhodanese-like domain-containing protein [Gelidibacter maritimus]|uniref:Rhodanese-like domain-containing protein n=1 Tax=Gelidibacter maritimus TaxID=2761487 RepID=A0A7W2M257_9FLAO|nr:rhodanese-like domain-containing protein [Gelidibacter maritimus]MBA6151344.1 rhodanese-like domain-containing protein [Gelidibacter maritimus]
MKNSILLTLLILILSFSCKNQNKNSTEHMVILTAPSFKEDISNGNVQLIDVRTPEEYNDGHIQNAVNIDFLSDDFSDKFDSFDKDEPLYIYCRSGNRSQKAAKKLSEMGFDIIYDLKGGYLNYE